MQIAIAVIVLLICAGFMIWFKKSEDQKRKKRDSDEEREAAAKATAQDFINAKDLGESCLYTLDNNVFAFVKIEGLCLELFSRQDQKNLCHTIATRLSSIRYPYKYIAVSRPVDISKSLQEYEELYENAEEGGRKTLLRNEMKELADMVMSGETLERQHYIAVWGSVNKVSEKDIVKRAEEIAAIFKDNGIQTIHAEVVDRKGIVRLCNLVNIPAYVHIESTDIDETMSVLVGN